MAKVSLKSLHKQFGNTIALKDLSLEINDKEFVALLGPSGCGKTTTLRCIAGLEDPDKGEIYIGDRRVNDLAAKDRDIAMVFQSYALYPHMSIYDNLAFPLKMRHMAKDETDKKVRKIAKLLQIEAMLERKPKQLSGGQQQRVAVGRALVREPQIFLMDEPLSNLDAKLRVYMRAELKKLQKEIGVTTIFVTHDQVEAMTMADRVAIMDRGVLQQYATPFEIFARPSSAFVGGFIGNPPMNFIDCTFEGSDGNAHLDAGIFKYPISKKMAGVLENSNCKELIIGIRPRNILVNHAVGENRWSVRAGVYVTEPLGDEMIVDIKLGEQILKALVPAETQVTIGQDVSITFPEERIYLFDRKTQAAIA